MQILTHGGRALSKEARLVLAALREGRLAFSVCLFAVLLLLAAQAPPRYRIEVGQEDGPGGDLPLVSGFWTPERNDLGTFRWTTDRALVRLPGIGQRALQVRLKIFPGNEEVARRGPRTIEIWASGRPLGELALRPVGAIYHVLLPPPDDRSGDQVLELRSATFVPTSDERALGVPVDAIRIEGVGGPALPAWRSTLAWLAAAVAAWLALRRAGLGPATAQRLLLVSLLLAGLAALLDPPRFAFGGGPALLALALGWQLVLLLTAAPAGLVLAGLVAAALAGAARLGGAVVGEDLVVGALQGLALALLLAAGLRPAVAALGRRLGVSIAPAAWRWLLVFALLVFALRYGGKIYPDAMPGDIGFHANRYADTVRGTVLLLSRNRGVDFPYPPALYLLLAPFSLVGLDRRVLLHLVGALLDALSPFLVYAIAARGATQAERSRGDAAALIAAAIYSFSAAGFMITWWNFSTHIFAQFTHLLLITALLLLFRRTTPDHRPPTTDHRPPTAGGQPSTSGGHPPTSGGQPSTSGGHPPTSGGHPPTSGGHGGPALQGRNSQFSILNSQFSIPLSAITAGLIALQSLVYLGHFGFWINMSLLGGIGLAALLLAIRRGQETWPTFWVLLISFVAAEAFAALFFYSGYTQLFRDQIEATRQGGLTGLAGRAPADPAALWRTLWDAGFRVHFGFFPLPLALCGLALLWRREPRTKNKEQRTKNQEPERILQNPVRLALRARPSEEPTQHATRNTQHVSRFTFHVSRNTYNPALITLILGTFAIAILFALLPFLSGSTLSTRWLMFSAWAISVCAALGARALWRSGRAGRLLLIAAGGYILWVTASQWLMALAWRVRPPEPF